jgi:hypothetical protein
LRCSRTYIFLVLSGAAVLACNPFAPELDESAVQLKFGDPTTVEGYFEAFRYAYQFKDTSLYSSLLDQSFIFSYKNYDRGLDLEWGRDEEVRTTAALFNSVQSLDLLWGNVLDSLGTATSFDITRTFSLDVTLNPSEVLHVDGRAIFSLRRDTVGKPWRAVRWRDESNL